jgi:hypothetical protein
MLLAGFRGRIQRLKEEMQSRGVSKLTEHETIQVGSVCLGGQRVMRWAACDEVESVSSGGHRQGFASVSQEPIRRPWLVVPKNPLGDRG